MQTILQHRCKAISVTSFSPDNNNAVVLTVVTQDSEMQIVLFGLPEEELAKLSGLGDLQALRPDRLKQAPEAAE